jgi:hypothetical protein
MTQKFSFLAMLFFCFTLVAKAQNNNVGIGTNTPNASAALEVQSTTQGMLIPRMTATQRALIATPATGLMVYQSDAPAGFYFYNGTAWTILGATGPQGATGNTGATGAQGPIGLTGATGVAGVNGQGVPIGGSANQVLSKIDGTNYNTQWVAPTSPFFKVSTANANHIIYNSSANYGKNFIVNGDSVNTNGGVESKMMFVPSKRAFRTGILISSNNWNIDSIGDGSFASGVNTKAIGGASTAMGQGSTASGALSTALGASTASGYISTSLGASSFATGNYSTAMGSTTTASGVVSTSMGGGSIASGDYSTAMGISSNASGYSSTAIGHSSKAKSYAEIALGQWNDTLVTVNTTSFANDSNRVFTIGNGSGTRKTAFVVQQDGNIGINQRRPTEKLDIAGSIKIVDGTQGTGKVLTSDANGKASWATPSSLPTQTGNAGKFLTTDGTNPSWANVPGVRVELIATKTDATQQPARAQGTNTGDVITFNNVVTTPTLGSYSSNSYTVGAGQGGLYYVQVRSVSVDNATPSNTTGHWFKIEIDPVGATGPSFINERDIYGPYPVVSANTNFPTGLRGRSEISAVVQLNAGDSFVIKGLSANSSVDNSIKNDGSCKLTILKLN